MPQYVNTFLGTELLIPKNNTASLAAEQVANLC